MSKPSTRSNQNRLLTDYERRGAFFFDGELGTSHKDCRSPPSLEMSCILFRFPEPFPAKGSFDAPRAMDLGESVRVATNGLSESSVSLTCVSIASALLGPVEGAYRRRSVS